VCEYNKQISERILKTEGGREKLKELAKNLIPRVDPEPIKKLFTEKAVK